MRCQSLPNGEKMADLDGLLIKPVSPISLFEAIMGRPIALKNAWRPP